MRLGIFGGSFNPPHVAHQLACAYVLAQPIFSTAPIEQVSAFYTAPFAVIAGLAGSLLVATVAGRDAAAAVAARPTLPTPRPQETNPAPTAKGSASVPAQAKPVKATARAQVPVPANGTETATPAAQPAADPKPAAKPDPKPEGRAEGRAAVATGTAVKPAGASSADMKTPAAGTATIGRQGKRGRRG